VSVSATRLVLRGERDARAAIPRAFARAEGGAAQRDAPPPFLWRLDKDEVGSLVRTVKDNLVRLVLGRSIEWPEDGALAGAAGAEETDAAAPPLPGGAGRGDLKRQALLIDLAPPRFWPSAELPWVAEAGADELGRGRLPSAFARLPSHAPAVRALREEFESALNDDQRAAVLRALSARDFACMVGMPGTGKTSTVSFLVRCLVALGRSVLITSHTHSAVDTLFLKLVEANVDLLRVGRASSVHPAIRPFTLETIVASGALPSLRALHERLQHAQVVGSTCLGIRHPLFARRAFDFVIIDEASQIPEPIALGPLRSARAFLLVGDHLQLPPLVVSPIARAGGMDVSLFKRLAEAHPAAVATLATQ
jgi:hypothetical protein